MTSQAPKSPQKSSQPSSVQQSSSKISALWRFVKHVFGYYEQPAKPLNTLNKRSKVLDLSDPRLYCRVRSLERCYRKDTAIEATRKRLERYWEDAST